MATSTKGPWHVSRNGFEGAEGMMTVCLLEEGGDLIVRAAKGIRLGDQELDAHLIAAAPELLEALTVVVNELGALIPSPSFPYLGDWPSSNSADRECMQKAYVTARAAIAKLNGA